MNIHWPQIAMAALLLLKFIGYVADDLRQGTPGARARGLIASLIVVGGYVWILSAGGFWQVMP